MKFFDVQDRITIMLTSRLTVVGAGLAGCEAAWQAAESGVNVLLFEMRPLKNTEAHRTDMLAELVCSNSLRSEEITTGPGLLKKEMEAASSLVMQAARESSVAAGSALAVDRDIFAGLITEKISSHPRIKVLRQELDAIPEGLVVIATGPLTSQSMTGELAKTIGSNSLYFYDAIAPIIDAESINMTEVFCASRYGKGGDDYINCPMNREEYEAFYSALMDADTAQLRDFENIKVFEGCMPVEVMARRGVDTLRFGPLKPVGLKDPATGKTPYAVVQLRQENRQKTAYNMVGFQTRLRQPEQRRVFRMIPGLSNVEFLRYGSMHRNTFINSPMLLNSDLSLKTMPDVYVAGQLAGVEGYIESAAMGFIAGINASRRLVGLEAAAPSHLTAHGALISHITTTDPAIFQPSNINFGLIEQHPDAAAIRDKKKKRLKMVDIALRDWSEYIYKILPSAKIRVEKDG
ncbi:MAG: methylenetetrahydrofolate--tRNA-(uracil(54)-C(5))-methyltransferase (FADH(2)-oxidizing) TrmFO [Dissulfurispiraceae bacterium]|jgi:methylenetetrahydrofolate--tRNA-(uracil-5-)-methyltransferase|nr:methylenetetrahydrofolate--tRNA-(uracil(54)-C(5))-methyltransferase (FADH(2)-oxidizing) TrmFO [Dissulfurispiraceae bacterium]